ncbi:MAG TPA: ABC-type transport auxiliary lipoprotein family protein [Stellaceae bacterium]|jgi:cholesterol transport system auxiliary component|nr:ABC-type transport auxiliary lipoprotein family protein [Stellaceae bacterium]
MSRLTRRLLLAGLAVTPAACSLLPTGGPAPKLYTLTPVAKFPPGAPVSWQLLVEVPASTAALDSERIALKRSPTTVDYFADAAWTDHAPLLVQELIVQSFEDSGRIAAVARQSLSLSADYILDPELRHFEANYAGAADNAPPEIHVQLDARLVKRPDRAIIANHSFDVTVRAAANSVPAVVDAFNAAFHQVVRPLVEWTLGAAR